MNLRLLKVLNASESLATQHSFVTGLRKSPHNQSTPALADAFKYAAQSLHERGSTATPNQRLVRVELHGTSYYSSVFDTNGKSSTLHHIRKTGNKYIRRPMYGMDRHAVRNNAPAQQCSNRRGTPASFQGPHTKPMDQCRSSRHKSVLFRMKPHNRHLPHGITLVNAWQKPRYNCGCVASLFSGAFPFWVREASHDDIRENQAGM